MVKHIKISTPYPIITKFENLRDIEGIKLTYFKSEYQQQSEYRGLTIDIEDGKHRTPEFGDMICEILKETTINGLNSYLDREDKSLTIIESVYIIPSTLDLIMMLCYLMAHLDIKGPVYEGLTVPERAASLFHTLTYSSIRELRIILDLPKAYSYYTKQTSISYQNPKHMGFLIS